MFLLLACCLSLGLCFCPPSAAILDQVFVLCPFVSDFVLLLYAENMSKHLFFCMGIPLFFAFLMIHLEFKGVSNQMWSCSRQIVASWEEVQNRNWHMFKAALPQSHHFNLRLISLSAPTLYEVTLLFYSLTLSFTLQLDSTRTPVNFLTSSLPACDSTERRNNWISIPWLAGNGCMLVSFCDPCTLLGFIVAVGLLLWPLAGLSCFHP